MFVVLFALIIHAFITLPLLTRYLGKAKPFKHFRNMTKIEFYDEDMFVGLGHACIALNKLVEARKAYNEALRVRPDYDDAYMGLGEVYARWKRYDDAESYSFTGPKCLGS